ncbi:dedicator of cytokinesis protein 3-like isoform X2 [Ornithodoros turicata]|uniref:dedicator of cytokinesis protein 3-like isoform X2 n=1 Tax=Ornithodoros turicata TaxID=34597 RepID=UPI0031386671
MWKPTKNKKYGVVICSYNGNTKCGLPLCIGECVHILEECSGWYRGYSMNQKARKGIFPASHVKLKSFRIDNEGPYETVTPVEDQTVHEATCVLREWYPIWKKLYLERSGSKFLAIQKVMRDIMDWRRQLVMGTLTQDQMWDIKAKITAKIDWGNRYLGMDLVPRVDCDAVNPDTLSPVELYQVHLKSSDSIGGLLGRGTMRRKEVQKALTHHLYLAMRDFSYNIGENMELRFTLYDGHCGEFISESFLVKVAKCGQSNFMEKLSNHFTVFTDLGNADLGKDLHLVIHVFRIGRMTNDSKKSTPQNYKRPVACGVLGISDILKQKNGSMLEDEQERTVKLSTCNENDFHQLHDIIVKKMNHKFSLLTGQDRTGVVITLRMLHGSLPVLQQENPLLFKNITVTRKRGFPDVIMPGDVRNDLYFTLEKGEFEKGGKSTSKNIEAAVQLVSPDGQMLENCLSCGTGEENAVQFRSVVLYHNNSPHWAETVKVSIPIERFDGAHIRIEFYHCSARDKDRKLLGFSFVHLMDDQGTILRNGSHEFFVYKCEDRSKLQDPASYLTLPSGPKDVVPPTTPSATSPPPFSPTGTAIFIRSPRESLQVTTLLCSTKLTQNGDLLCLLKWKENPDKIHDTLNKVMKLNGEEIVKFLQDILDALFSMFSTGDGNSTLYSGLVFKALIHIFSLLDSTKFEHFKPVMDAYVTGHFAAALVYKGLLSCVRHCSDLIQDAEEQNAIKNCFSSLEYIFKFIVQSRLLFARATGDQNEEDFKADLNELFSSFHKMLHITNDASIQRIQVTLVYSFSQIYEQLLKVLPVEEVGRIVKLTLSSLPAEASASLTQARLLCIHNTVKSAVFKDRSTRLDLLGVFVGHLHDCLSHGQEHRLCAAILSDILISLYHAESTPTQEDNHSSISTHIYHEVEVLVLGLLETLVLTVKNSSKDSSFSGPLVACLIALLRLMEERHYLVLWDHFHNNCGRRFSLREFLLHVFAVLHYLVQHYAFPRDWMIMRMVANHIALCALQEFSQILTLDFLDSHGCDKELWSNYFTLAVAFLTQPSLQLENFSEAKRLRILEKYGDMRVLMGFQILAMWNKLGDSKVHFLPEMVGPFLEVTLVPETELRKATLPIFFDMMDTEQRFHNNFKQVESELIYKLDILVSENKGDDEYRQLFNTILLDRVKSNDPVWKENGIAFINSITRLLERLLDYRNVLEGVENRDKRMSCTVNLLSFYRNEINRNEMYIRYIYKLCDLHLPAENYTEAAFTLKLHSDLLSWSDNMLRADEHYREQPEWQRREALYSRIIDYFDKGKCWEKGIPLCKELAELYEKKVFNYEKLSSILKTQAQFFDNILNQLRPEPEYFRVGFYGIGFPLFLRNKVFVYRGLEYEKIIAFTQRMQTQFPQAQILMKNVPPDESILNSDGQYIQICSAKPIPESRPEFEGQNIPDKILNYYLVNDVSIFQFDRPIHKEPVDKDNEFKSLWIERTVLYTDGCLPSILRWLEVTHQRVEEIPPIVHACESIEAMNKELCRLIAQYTSDPKRPISPLSMRLTGVIEAAVNGGIAKYQEAFFTSRYAQEHPEHASNIARLQGLILNKVHILEGGLSIHGRLAPQDVLPLQRRLVDRFVLMKQSIREAASPNMAPRIASDVSSASDLRRPSIINTPLPPVPGEKKPPSEPCSNRSSSSGSSLYGHLLPECSDDEGIYSRPKDDQQNGPSPGDRPPLHCARALPFTHPAAASPPPLPTRPRSVNLTSDQRTSSGEHQCHMSHRFQTHCRDHSDGSGCSMYASYAYPSPAPVAVSHIATTPVATVVRSNTCSPKMPTRRPHHLSESSATDENHVPLGSWSNQNGNEKAPPLPPRASERRATVADTRGLDDARPALPHRIARKASSPTMMATSTLVACPTGEQFCEAITVLDSCTPTCNPDLTLNFEPPPPLPCKRTASIKGSDSIPGTPTHAAPPGGSADTAPLVVNIDL